MKEAILLTDGYKLDHRRQYPENTEYVYSNWTPRSCHYYPEATEGAVVFGIQYFIEVYPTGFVSIVSDTWDFWKVMTEYLPKLKDEILARDGRLVIRPDSGNPVHIIAGYKQEDFENWREQVEAFKIISPIEWVGAYEVLWKIFGGTINEKGYEDQVTKEQEDKSCLQTVFEDGKLVKEWSLSQIRANVNNSIVLED